MLRLAMRLAEGTKVVGAKRGVQQRHSTLKNGVLADFGDELPTKLTGHAKIRLCQFVSSWLHSAALFHPYYFHFKRSDLSVIHLLALAHDV